MVYTLCKRVDIEQLLYISVDLRPGFYRLIPGRQFHDILGKKKHSPWWRGGIKGGIRLWCHCRQIFKQIIMFQHFIASTSSFSHPLYWTIYTHWFDATEENLYIDFTLVGINWSLHQKSISTFQTNMGGWHSFQGQHSQKWVLIMSNSWQCGTVVFSPLLGNCHKFKMKIQHFDKFRNGIVLGSLAPPSIFDMFELKYEM